jgi:acyl carrier protein
VAHADTDWGHEYNPNISNDNRWMVYMASAGCHQGDDCDYDIWLHQLGADPSERERVTQNPAFDGYPQIYVGPLWQPVSQPRLLLTPGYLTFYASADALPAAQTVKVKNTGGSTLGPAVVTPDPSAPWLEAALDSTGAIVFSLNGEAITQGIQHATVTVTVDRALGSPFSVPVTLNADDSFPYPEGGAPEASDWDGGAPEAAGPDPGAANPDAAAGAVSVGGGGCGCALYGVPRAAASLSLLGLALFAMWFFKKSPPSADATAASAPTGAGLTSASVVETLRATVARISRDHLPPEAIDIRAHLLDSGYIDSLSSTELLADIERRFGVRIDEMQIVGKLCTIAALAREIEGHAVGPSP